MTRAQNTAIKRYHKIRSMCKLILNLHALKKGSFGLGAPNYNQTKHPPHSKPYRQLAQEDEVMDSFYVPQRHRYSIDFNFLMLSEVSCCANPALQNPQYKSNYTGGERKVQSATKGIKLPFILYKASKDEFIKIILSLLSSKYSHLDNRDQLKELEWVRESKVSN